MSSIVSAVTQACRRFADWRSASHPSAALSMWSDEAVDQRSVSAACCRDRLAITSICLAEQQAAAGSAIVPELARRDPSVDGANFDAAQQGNLAFRDKLFVRSVTVPRGPSLPTRSLMSNFVARGRVAETVTRFG